MEKWFVQTKKADFKEWSEELGIDVVTARLMRNRDIETLEDARKFLYSGIEDMHDHWLLKDMDKAVEAIVNEIKAGGKIRVIGDYDVDGVTSSFILSKGFSCLGADVSVAIPHRIHDGYGLSDGLVEDAHSDGISMIVTCDNGISARDQINLATSLGMKVVVTDHHEVPFEMDGEKMVQILPEAIAVVNPKRDDCSYPFKGICGAMVAYKLICAIKDKTADPAFDESVMRELLSFAALGTVCDVMDLKDENRIVVKEGIRIMATTTNKGLQALMQVNNLNPEDINTYRIGFVIGPCINASGRLDTAEKALELLNSDSLDAALALAAELKEINDRRKELTSQGVGMAEKYVEEHNLEKRDVWVIYLPEVHESIAGIIAGRIRERYNHPVFILTRGENGIKGSGRSIEGYHMQQHLVVVGELLDNYGGHSMAAGLSLQEENLEALEKALNENTGIKPEDFDVKVSIDIPMPLDYASIDLVKEIEKLEPFGNGNPTPLFAQADLDLYGAVLFGKDKQYTRLKVRTPEGKSYEITTFDSYENISMFLDEKYGAGSGEKLISGQATYKISVAYQLGINNYKGEYIQFTLKKYK